MTYSEDEVSDLLAWIHRDLELPGDSQAFQEDCLAYLRSKSGPTCNRDAEIASLRLQLDRLQRVNESLQSVIQDVY